jgi:hypothetical protein
MEKTNWKVGDWAILDMDIVQIKKLDEWVEVTTGIISTSGHLLDRLRPFNLRNKVTAESFEYLYRQLKTIRGERGFNYPDISRYFADLCCEAMDGEEDDTSAMDAASDFVRRARDYQPVIDGVDLFYQAA